MASPEKRSIKLFPGLKGRGRSKEDYAAWTVRALPTPRYL
jgi:hypothetical protein